MIKGVRVKVPTGMDIVYESKKELIIFFSCNGEHLNFYIEKTYIKELFLLADVLGNL